MKFTLDWLHEHLETEKSSDHLASALTALGLEVESVTRQDENVKGLKFARILSAEPHPHAEHLRVCQVECDKTVQVVCGAPNAVAGLMTVYAEPGAVIPQSGMVLKEAKLRGVVSSGMLLSSFELGLDEEHEGIMDMKDQNIVTGMSYAQWAGMDSIVFDVAVTPNRPDWLGVRGIARDLAAAGYGKLKPLAFKLQDEADYDEPDARWEIEDDDNACAGVAGRVVRDLGQAVTPTWMRRRLLAIGQNSISALVDISNYITFDLARPLHFYDLERLPSKTLKMTRLKQEQEFSALDNSIRRLPIGTTVITSDEAVVGMGGIIGGQESACSPDTKHIFIESAHFMPAEIFNASKQQQLTSEASYRFERGIDPNSVLWGADVAAAMTSAICGGRVSKRLACGSTQAKKKTIVLQGKKLNDLAGIKIPLEEAQTILTDLGCQCTHDQHRITATPASWRQDIEHDVCLIEEVFRIRGLDTIPEIPLPPLAQSKVVPPSWGRLNMVRRQLVTQGFLECVSLTFVDENEAQNRDTLIRLANPLTQDQTVMRQSLVPGLVRSAQVNHARGEKDLALFEIGPVFEREDNIVIEHDALLALRCGTQGKVHWRHSPRLVDAYDAKATCYQVLETLGVRSESLKENALEPVNTSWYHPGRSQALFLGRQEVARYGLLSPRWAQHWRIPYPLVLCEVWLDQIPTKKKKKTLAPYIEDRFPKVERDLSFYLDKDVQIGQLLAALRPRSDERLREMDVIDLYHGKKGEKSVTLRLILQDKKKTLLEEEILAMVNQMVSIATSKFKARLRDH